MDKKRLNNILIHAPREEVLALAGLIEENNSVSVLRPAARTLILLRYQEPRGQKDLWAGEAPAESEAVGMSIVIGGDREKGRAMAVIDAAHTAQLPIWEEIVPRLLDWEQRPEDRKRLAEAGRPDSFTIFREFEDSTA